MANNRGRPRHWGNPAYAIGQLRLSGLIPDKFTINKKES